MKKCPNCQKEFPDTMRFCQTDGTPLGDPVEVPQPEDPLKTTVVRQEDIASSIPPADPFKTMVASSETKEDSGDLLQLPEESFDPLKTMVAPPVGGQDKPVLEEPTPAPPKFEDIKEEIKAESSPFTGFSQPNEPLPETPKDISNEPTVAQPEPPKFNEPSLSPPPFGDLSAKEEDELPQTVMQNPWDAGSAPKSESSPFSNESPFSKPSDAPVSSPFDAPRSSTNEPPTPFGSTPPSSPFDQPPSSFDAPRETPYNQPPQSSFDQPQTFEPPTPTFQEPSNQFGQQQFDQMNQGFGGNQPLQASEWTPPPSPEQGWGDQGLGANTPFQPPPAAMAGQNQTLPIVSLVFGILSVCCYVGPLTGIVALITGYLGMKNANNDPAQYGGKGLAIAGMITGGIFFAIYTLLWLLYLVGVVSMISLGGAR
jgi:hypothetical protein